MRIFLPFLGSREVMPHPTEVGHWLWLDLFGWHDCSRSEDYLIRRAIKQMNQVEAK